MVGFWRVWYRCCSIDVQVFGAMKGREMFCESGRGTGYWSGGSRTAKQMSAMFDDWIRWVVADWICCMSKDHGARLQLPTSKSITQPREWWKRQEDLVQRYGSNQRVARGRMSVGVERREKAERFGWDGKGTLFTI